MTAAESVYVVESPTERKARISLSDSFALARSDLRNTLRCLALNAAGQAPPVASDEVVADLE
ncbi:hypothetical protein COLO4_06184 [Corchorus olitorius]|uniref:Uncharacterized protein n=1 Tax=Corchorus olitorius TaxID=93759 RepID=A0A1R3KNP1_9ROSI|nr:hypothetical protein COLO4_06184 [Corchorus olitorius]